MVEADELCGKNYAGKEAEREGSEGFPGAYNEFNVSVRSFLRLHLECSRKFEYMVGWNLKSYNSRGGNGTERVKHK